MAKKAEQVYLACGGKGVVVGVSAKGGLASLFSRNSDNEHVLKLRLAGGDYATGSVPLETGQEKTVLGQKVIVEPLHWHGANAGVKVLDELSQSKSMAGALGLRIESLFARPKFQF